MKIVDLTEEQRAFLNEALDEQIPQEMIALDFTKKFGKEIKQPFVSKYRTQRILLDPVRLDYDDNEGELKDTSIEIVNRKLKILLEKEKKEGLTGAEERLKTDYLGFKITLEKAGKAETTPKHSLMELTEDRYCRTCGRPYNMHPCQEGFLICAQDTDIAGNLMPLCGKCNVRHLPTVFCPRKLGDPKPYP